MPWLCLQGEKMTDYGKNKKNKNELLVKKVKDTKNIIFLQKRCWQIKMD